MRWPIFDVCSIVPLLSGKRYHFSLVSFIHFCVCYFFGVKVKITLNKFTCMWISISWLQWIFKWFESSGILSSCGWQRACVPSMLPFSLFDSTVETLITHLLQLQLKKPKHSAQNALWSLKRKLLDWNILYSHQPLFEQKNS